MQTKYASSPGEANLLLWTSLKPSHQWLSWGDWHCRYFSRRTAGNCTWEPGCTGLCWAGCGWTFFLKEQARGCHDETHKRHGRYAAIFPLYRNNARCVPDAERRLIRGSEIYPTCLAHCWPWAESWTEMRRNVKLFVLLVPSRYLDLQPEMMRKHEWICWKVLDFSKIPNMISNLKKNIYIYLYTSLKIISPVIRFSQISTRACSLTPSNIGHF